MSKPMNTWEEKLRNIIENISYDESLSVDEKTEIIKAFIRSELQQQRKELVKMIEESKSVIKIEAFDLNEKYRRGWINALDDIINKIGGK